LTKTNANIWVVPLLGIVVYANSLGGAFHYDDFHSLVENNAIRSWDNALAFFVDPSLFSADVSKAMYRPLLLLSYAFNYAVGGYDVIGYHTLNILFHAVASVLVTLVAGRLLGDRQGALLSGMLYAVHPLTSEPVNYISSRSESLMACFYLATLYCYMSRGDSARWWSPFFYACALLTKSVALTVPLMLWCYDRWRREAAWRRLLPHILLWGGYIGLLVANRFLGNSLRAPVRAWDVQLWTQTKALVYYLKLLIFPWALNVEHQFFESRSLGDPTVVGGGLLLLSLAYLVWLARHKLSGFALVCAGGVLLPSTLMPLNMLVNERRLYLVLAATCWLVPLLWQRLPRSLFYVWITLFALLSMQRNQVWQSEMTLWADAVKKAPDMYRAQSNWGKALQESGHWEEALVVYKKAIELDPRHGDAYNNLATIHHLHGNLSEAILWYEKALERYPDYEEIHQNLADAHAQRGDLIAAITAYQRALGENPQRGEIWSNYGQALYRGERTEEAETAFLRAVELMPELAEPYNNLGNIYADRREYTRALSMYSAALARAPHARGQVLVHMATTHAALGHIDSARTLVQEAMAYEPGRADWLYRLGRVERSAGRPAEAAAAFAAAVRIDATHIQAVVHWGEVLLDEGKVEEAAKHFARATAVDPGYVRAWYGLGRALKVIGAKPEARRALERFLELWRRDDARAEQVRAWLVELEGDL
jgi:protein O-mannosyl-transferase